MHNGHDNRLTPELVNNGLKPALDAVEKHWRDEWRIAQTTNDKDGGKGAVILVGRMDQDKFFSNGKYRQNVCGNLTDRFVGLDFAVSSKDITFFPCNA